MEGETVLHPVVDMGNTVYVLDLAPIYKKFRHLHLLKLEKLETHFIDDQGSSA